MEQQNCTLFWLPSPQIANLPAETASELSYMDPPSTKKWTGQINTSKNPFSLGTLIYMKLTHFFCFGHKHVFKATLLNDSFGLPMTKYFSCSYYVSRHQQQGRKCQNSGENILEDKTGRLQR